MSQLITIITKENGEYVKAVHNQTSAFDLKIFLIRWIMLNDNGIEFWNNGKLELTEDKAVFTSDKGTYTLLLVSEFI